MDVVNKPWGTQVWQGHELIMIMRAGTRTSIHKHNHHETHLECVSGECWVTRFSDDLACQQDIELTTGDWIEVPSAVLHEIQATTDTVIRERYMSTTEGSPPPHVDIERVSHADLCQAYGMWDDNTKNPLIKE